MIKGLAWSATMLFGFLFWAVCLVGCARIPSLTGHTAVIGTPAVPAPLIVPANATPAESELALARAAMRDAQERVRKADDALADERTAAAQAKIWWFAGIMGVLALFAVGVAIFVPSVARWAVRFAIAAGAVAAVAVFAAGLWPYLPWIGGGLTLVGLVGAVVYWRLDAKSRDQLVQGVEDMKAHVPDYRTILRQRIDEDADKTLDAARKRLGLS